MRRDAIGILLATGLTLAAAPLPAQLDGLGLTDANGCAVFTGTGSGQIVSDWGVYPVVDVATVHLVNKASGHNYTLVYEEMSFPSVPLGADGVIEHRGLSNWRILENGAYGTNRYRLVLTPDDPANPTRLDFVGDSEVIKGNRYTSGGAHIVASMDYWTGAFTISQFSAVLCLP